MRHVNEEDGLESLGDLQVVGGAERLAAQLDELELSNVRRGKGYVDLATPDGERAMLLDWLGAGEGFEQLGHFATVMRVDGVKVDLAEGPRTFAVVCERWDRVSKSEGESETGAELTNVRVEALDSERVLDELDAGQELLALDAVLV